MKITKLTPQMKKYLITSLFAAGLSVPTVFVSTHLTEPSEGTVLGVYADPIGLPTSCIGHLDKKATVGTVKSFEECVEVFVKDVEWTQSAMKTYTRVTYKSEWMEAALTDFTINKGIGNYANSTLLRNLNQKKYDLACDEVVKWVYATYQGKKIILPGLQVRADKQWKYCMGEIPYDVQDAYDKFLEEYKHEIETTNTTQDSK